LSAEEAPMNYSDLVKMTAKMIAEKVKEDVKNSRYNAEELLDLTLDGFGQDVADYAMAEIMDMPYEDDEE
jgi:hypothetical protein